MDWDTDVHSDGEHIAVIHVLWMELVLTRALGLCTS